MADHSQHVTKIKDKLEDEVNVVSDRYIDSRIAYQSVTLDIEDEFEWIEKIHKWSLFPDETILIDIPPEVGVSRTSTEDKFENVKFLSKVRDNYLELSNKYSDRYHIIDGEQSEREVIEEALEIISKVT
jgi:dTMP kinase